MLQHLRTYAWVFALAACRLSTAAEEVLLPLDDAATQAAIDSPPDAGQSAIPPSSSPPAAIASAADASADLRQDAALANDASVPLPPAADAGSATSTPTPTSQPDGDAATPPAMNDPARQAAEDLACAFEFATCLLLDPLNYAECGRMNADHCDLLSTPSMQGSAADGGTDPTAACALQTADCIARNPDKALDCIAMQDQCTL